METASFIHKIQHELNDLAADLWPASESIELHYNPVYDVWLGPNGQEGLRHVFGSSAAYAFRLRLKCLRKMKWKDKQPNITLKAPKDSMLVIRPAKEGIILISPESERVFKSFSHADYISLLEGEVERLKFFQASAASAFSPPLIKEGKFANQGKWLLCEFRSNSHALEGETDPDQYILDHLQALVIQPMTAFYRAYGMQITSIADWVRAAGDRVKSHPSPEPLMKLLNALTGEAALHQDYQLLISQVHQDLHARNILFDGKNPTVIDWEGSTQGLVIIDFFDFVRRILNKSWLKKNMFWDAPEMKKVFQLYRQWCRSEYKLEIPEGTEKLTLMLYALERTLIQWELRQNDRMKDKSGFEYRISQSV